MMETSVNNVVAIIYIVRILFLVWILPPVLVIVCPFVVHLIFSIVDLFSNGFGALLILCTITFTLGGKVIISAYSPSARQREDALRKSSVALPVLSFIGSRLLLWFLLIPVSVSLGIDNFLKVRLQLPYMKLLSMSTAMVILGLSVVFRYVGPMSVVRCSPFPLVSRPLTTFVRSMGTRFTSFEALLGFLSAPTPNTTLAIPGAAMNQSSLLNNKFRRYQGPTLQPALVLLMVSSCLALLVSFVYCSQQSDLPSIMLHLSFLLPVLMHLMMTCLDGKSHELDPVRYQKKIWQPNKDMPQLHAYLRSILCSILFVPICVSFWKCDQSISFQQRWKIILLSIFIAGLSSLYLSVIDFMCRVFLFKSRFNLQRLVTDVTTEISHGKSAEVAIGSFLMENSALVESVFRPAERYLPLEDQELRRNELDAKALVEATAFKFSDFGLAEDLLRALILESLGGTDGALTSNLGASQRHMKMVENFVGKNPNSKIGINHGETLAVPFVRALCAYVSGFGLELERISARPIGGTAAMESWALPPCAIHCSKWAIIGATRCVVYSITSDDVIASTDWRGSCLSMFVPTLLVAAFRLRCGVLSYEKDVFLKREFHLLAMIDTCDTCATFLLKTLQRLEGVRPFEISIPYKECRLWIEKLTSRIDEISVVRTPPLLLLENEKEFQRNNKPNFALKSY
mmetsp:Transcript_32316/g.47796  ORF Transcript_32316/g.47796 Transcript_32316/m.47796 type:complete len:685 (+) Transcript_32316:1595-3649(+)